MKILKSALFAALGAMLATGCISEDMHYDNDNTDKQQDTGYLSLAAFEAEVIADSETETFGTRAEVIPTGNFKVEIVNSAGETVKSFLYADKPEEPIELETGRYTLRISSGEVPETAWDNPVYAAEKEFVIVRRQETAIGRVLCKLASVKVTVEYSADIVEQLSHDTKVNVRLGSNDVDFNFDEKRAAYLKPHKAVDEINLTITGSFADSEDGSTFEMTSKLPDVKAGQWRRITIIIEHTLDGNLHVGVEVENWVFDEEITVETSRMLTETIIDENPQQFGMPQAELEGGDIDAPFTLTPSMFDAYGDCTVPVRVKVSAEHGIEALKLDISSDNPLFITSLGELGLASSFDLCSAGSAAPILKALGYPTGSDVKGKNEVTFNLQGQMKQLNAFSGEHRFRITVEDALGQQSVKTLTIVASQSGNGPVIEWVDHDIDQRYEITEGLDVTVNIYSDAGIRDFLVTINSDTIPAKDLEDMNLSQNIDLVHPGSMEETLRNMKFPVREEVENKNFVTFSITEFIDLLGKTGAGNQDFVLNVTDMNGATTVKTLMLVKK